MTFSIVKLEKSWRQSCCLDSISIEFEICNVETKSDQQSDQQRFSDLRDWQDGDDHDGDDDAVDAGAGDDGADDGDDVEKCNIETNSCRRHISDLRDWQSCQKRDRRA